MSLSRSPSPHRGGGWSGPGLATPSSGTARRQSPMRGSATGGVGNVRWTPAQNRPSDKSSSFAPLSQGFGRHFRRVSGKLPIFSSRDYSHKEKLGRGRWGMAGRSLTSKDILPFLGRTIWKMRLQLLMVTAIILFFVFVISRMYSTGYCPFSFN
jgi:mannan polymerase II complex MNN10 subunit